MTDTPLAPEPDAKDWTWVLDRPCPDCGFVAAEYDMAGLVDLVRATTPGYLNALAAHDARRRPDPRTWSVLEYSAHVRDVHRVFGDRMAWALEQDEPVVADWDQDATALEERYDLQDPNDVASALVEAADQVAELYATIGDHQLDRGVRRSNGSVFSVLTLARYHLHDVVHHLHDITAHRPAEGGH